MLETTVAPAWAIPEEAIAAGIYSINADSVYEIELIEARARALGKHEGGRPELHRRRDTYDDLLANEVW